MPFEVKVNRGQFDRWLYYLTRNHQIRTSGDSVQEYYINSPDRIVVGRVEPDGTRYILVGAPPKEETEEPRVERPRGVRQRREIQLPPMPHPTPEAVTDGGTITYGTGTVGPALGYVGGVPVIMRHANWGEWTAAYEPQPPEAIEEDITTPVNEEPRF